MAISLNDYTKKYKNQIETNRTNLTHLSASGKLTYQQNKEKKAKQVADNLLKKSNIDGNYINTRTAPTRATGVQALMSPIERYGAVNDTIEEKENKRNNIVLSTQGNKYEDLDKKIATTQKKYSDYYNSKEYQNYIEEYYKTPLYQYYADMEKVENKDDFSFGEKAFTSFFGGLRSVLHMDRQYKTTDSNGKTVYVDLPNLQQLKSKKIIENSGTLGKIYQESMASIGQIVPSMVAGAVTGGLGFGASLGSLSTMAVNSYSSSKNQMLLNGYSEEQAEGYGLLSSAVEVATEKMFGGLGKLLGTGALDDVVTNKLTKNITNRVVKGLADLGISSIGEGVEELVSGLAQPAIQKLALGKKEDYLTLLKNEALAEDFFAGVMSSVILGGISSISGNINNSNINNQTTMQNQLNNQNDIGEGIKKQRVNGQWVESPNSDSSFSIDNNITQLSENVMPSINNTQDNSLEIKTIEQINLEKQINSAISDNQSNSKSYLGKVTSFVANKIQKTTGIDVSNRKHVLTNNDIRHMLKQHGNQDTEGQKGQIAITPKDIENIPDIISNPTDIIKGTDNKQGQTIRYIKRYNDNSTYVVEVVPDNSNALIIKTMWKKPSTLTNSITTPSSTSETKGSDISTTLIDNNNTTNSLKSQNVTLSNNSNMQKREENSSKISNPLEISKLTPEDANTTPKLPNVKRNKTGDGDSRFYENIRDKTNMLSDEQKTSILSEEEVQYYDKITNEESLNKAFERLEKNGQIESLNWFSKDSEKANSTDVAEGWILLKQYADNNNADGMVAVAKKLRKIGTKAGQTVQAFNIIERMTPEGMVKYAQSELSEAYEKMIKNKSKDWIDKHQSDFDLKPEEVAFIMETMKEVATMEDSYDKRVKLAEIQKVMIDKLPPEKGAGIKSWMRISMLFNPKTQVRNVAGNAIIAPVNSFSDLFASGIDKLVSKKTGVRTTGTTNLKNYTKGFKKGLFESYNDFKKGINTRNIDGNRFELKQGKSFNNNNIIGKNLNRVDNLLSFMLDAGDRGFYEASFVNSINNQMVLNNTTEITQDMIDIATQEALSRTWQDSNTYTNAVLKIRKWLNGNKNYGLGDVLIPFAKTPANLTKAIIDYSPAGFVNTLINGNNLRKSISNGQYTAQMQHKFVQSLGKATAGTMLYVLGYALATAGIVSGESDDDKDVKNFLQNTLGISSYSIKIGDKSFTYDWAQPVAAPLSITANIVNSKSNKETALLEAIVGSLDSAGSILLEQSFMQSINDVLNNNDGFASGLITEVLELPARAIPTLSKQIADMIDGTQRQTFEYDQPIKSAINYAKSKIPGLSKTLAPSVDTMGREIQKYGGKNNIFNVFLNPANVNTENISKSAEEIYRLYKETGDTTIMPRVAPYYVNKDNEKITLNSSQRAEYQKTSGKIIEENIEKLLKNNQYKNMSDSEKADIINNIVNYSYNIAQSEILGTEISQNYEKAYLYGKVGNVSDYYILKSQDFVADKDEDGNSISGSKKQKIVDYINSMSLSVANKAILIKFNGYSISDYDKQIIEYINNQKLSIEEKTQLLTKLGYTIKNGRVYW